MSHEFDARVYDLDGTLVRLAVDWEAAASGVLAVYEDAGVEVDPETGLWELLADASRHGIEAEAEVVFSEREIDGATASERLPLADELESARGPVGVCSLNCEAAVVTALERHGLAKYVNAVVGRDTVREQKPDPAPLLEAIDRMGATAVSTVFVGDSESDEEAAHRAGVPFQWVEQRLAEQH